VAASLHIIEASTSGHTAFVLDTLVKFLGENASDLTITRQRAEQAAPEDLTRGDVLLLASASWNTGGREGQLNPHMHAFLKERAKSANLGGKPVALIGLGDERYHYTARALQHLEEYVRSHGGKLLTSLRIVNEPYGQEEKVRAWGKELLETIKGVGVRV